MAYRPPGRGSIKSDWISWNICLGWRTECQHIFLRKSRQIGTFLPRPLSDRRPGGEMRCAWTHVHGQISHHMHKMTSYYYPTAYRKSIFTWPKLYFSLQILSVVCHTEYWRLSEGWGMNWDVRHSTICEIIWTSDRLLILLPLPHCPASWEAKS